MVFPPTPLRVFPPLAGGQHLWPGQAGSTVFLVRARGSARICLPVSAAWSKARP